MPPPYPTSLEAFWTLFAPRWEHELLASGERRRRRATRLHPAEILTILILFQQSGYRTFKGFYTHYVQAHLRQEFPTLVSYTRFVELMPRFLVPLAIYLHNQMGHCTGISFIDSTSTRPRSPSAIRRGSSSIASSGSTPAGARPRWGGSTASNSICSSMTVVSCSPSAPPLAIQTTAVLFLCWCVGSLDGSLGTKAISQHRLLSSSSLAKRCASAPNCARTGATSLFLSPITCSCANARLSKPSSINSRMSGRSRCLLSSAQEARARPGCPSAPCSLSYPELM
jgi:hypothetical protein